MIHRCHSECNLWSLCHCAARCGQRTRPARYSDVNRGWVVGQPLLCVPGHNVGTSKMLSTAPLRAQMQLALPLFVEKERMLELYADRFGVSTRTVWRDLTKIMRDEWVCDDLADKWAIFLQVHPVLLWPEEWMGEVA